MKQIPLIIDTDPGIDDAVAIALAVFNPRFERAADYYGCWQCQH